jgi:hypothetical protein
VSGGCTTPNGNSTMQRKQTTLTAFKKTKMNEEKKSTLKTKKRKKIRKQTKNKQKRQENEPNHENDQQKEKEKSNQNGKSVEKKQEEKEEKKEGKEERKEEKKEVEDQKREVEALQEADKHQDESTPITLFKPDNTRSDVWNHFRLCRERPNEVVCLTCNPQRWYKYTSTTSQLLYHINTVHNNKPKQQNPLLPIFTQNKRATVQLERLVKLIVCDMRPISLPRSPAFLSFCLSLDPYYRTPSESTILQVIESMNAFCCASVKAAMMGVESVVITTDMWTCQAGYLGCTVHFINDKWELISHCLKVSKTNG